MAKTHHATIHPGREGSKPQIFCCISCISASLLFSDCICSWLGAGRLLLKREYCRSVSFRHRVFIPEGQVINKRDKEYTGRHHLLARPWVSKLYSGAALHKRAILTDAEEHAGER